MRMKWQVVKLIILPSSFRVYTFNKFYWFEEAIIIFCLENNYVQMNLSRNYKADEYQTKSAAVNGVGNRMCITETTALVEPICTDKIYLHDLSLFVIVPIVMLAVCCQYIQVTQGKGAKCQYPEANCD